MDEFLIAKSGFGNENSFCRRISYGLKDLAIVGNMYFKVFNIYLNNGTDITLSDTFAKMFNYDYNQAFMLIKELIVKLLKEVEKENFEYIEKCELNGFFKYRLLIVYYPDKFIPVTAETTINGYCEPTDK